MNMPCVGLLLAAGRSRRFGNDKLVQPLADGTPLVVASARALHAVGIDTLAVVGDLDGEVAGLLVAQGVRVVDNPRSADGVGTSIACGVAASRGAAGWVIALGDMPWIPPGVVQAVVAGLAHGADIIAPVCRGRRGHPVGFSARHAPALLDLQADEGAHGIIAAHRGALQLIEVADQGVLLDVDVPAALQVGGRYR